MQTLSQNQPRNLGSLFNILIASFLVAFSLFPLSLAYAAEPWSLTDITLVPRRVDSISLKQQSVITQRAGAEPVPLPLDQFVSAVRGSAAPVAPGKFVLHIRDGQRFVGLPVSSTASSITWSTTTVGDRVLPLASVAAIDRLLIGPSGESRQEDLVTLANHDAVRGVLSSIDPDTVTMTVGDAITPIALANVTAIRLASTAAAPAKSANFVVGLIDGTTVHCQNVQSDGAQWTLTIGTEESADEPGNTVSVTADQITRIEYPGGPVRWLSTMPAQIIYTPYLTESFPPVMDASVTGGPIRAAGRQYDRGIGVHAKTVLTFDLDGTRKSFRTRYAAEPSLPLVDAIVRIKLDGKTVHEQPVRGGTLSPVVWADLTGAKTLTLEVDFGPGHATQDRINWIEPALLTTPVPPASQPATQAGE
jgi:hypothetical protein